MRKHGDLAAAAEALEWAERCAEGGEFAYAVKWLDRADALLGGLTPTYRRRRRSWLERRTAPRLGGRVVGRSGAQRRSKRAMKPPIRA
jgi:hypothetical protein